MTKTIDESQLKHSLEVLERVKNLGSEGIPGFEWPSSANEHKTISQNSRLYKNLNLEESFAAAYGKTMKKATLSALKNQSGLNECKSLKPGDVISLRILDVNKKGVVFEQNAYKETLISTINLYQYPTFRNFVPKEPVKCKVMSVDHSKVYVDPFQPLIEDFIQGVQDTIKVQANIKAPVTTKVKDLQHMRSGYIGKIRIPSISDMCGKDVYMQAFIPGSQITLNIESDFEKWEGKDIDAFITNLSVRPGTTNVTIACSAKEYLKFQGNLKMIQMFKDYCEGNKTWNKLTKTAWDGNITGICNTRSKTGVFVEIPELNITGMVPVSVEDINKYHPGKTSVKVTGFDEPVKFDKTIGQMIHLEPWTVENDILKRINIKPVLEFVK